VLFIIVETRGVSCSFAFNVSTDFLFTSFACSKESSFALSSLALEPQTRLSPCWVLQTFHNIRIPKKRIQQVYPLFWWRRGESNPCPKWILTNFYECRFLFAQLIQEKIITRQISPRFYFKETLNLATFS